MKKATLLESETNLSASSLDLVIPDPLFALTYVPFFFLNIHFLSVRYIKPPTRILYDFGEHTVI